jgi:hypothetical protein
MKMKDMLKRLLLVIGFFPVMLYAFLKWLFTGYDLDETFGKFLEYCTNYKK